MSRVDVPTMRCDRCGHETQDLNGMAAFERLTHYHMSGHHEWDLCPPCWLAFERGFVVAGGQS